MTVKWPPRPESPAKLFEKEIIQIQFEMKQLLFKIIPSKDVRHYESPCVKSVTGVELEIDLLVLSVYLGTVVETSGQLNGGYFEGEDIVSEDNAWGE